MNGYKLQFNSVSPFNAHVGRFSEALCRDFKVVFTDNLPMGAGAACDLEDKQLLFPIFDPSKFNEKQAHKMMGYSAHERKHAHLSSTEVTKRIKDLMEECQKTGKSRSLMFQLHQLLEDVRIETNENYALPGDLHDLSFLRAYMAEDMDKKTDQLDENPLGRLSFCVLFTKLQDHPAFNQHRVPMLPNLPGMKEAFDKAMEILNDGRFDQAKTQTRRGEHVSLDLAIEIEKAWSEIIPQDTQDKSKDGKPEKGSGEGSGDSSGQSGEPGEPGDSGDSKPGDSGDSKPGESESDSRTPEQKQQDLNDAFDKMQEENEISADQHKVEAVKISLSQGFKQNNSEGKKIKAELKHDGINIPPNPGKYVGFNPYDKEVTASPNESIYRATSDRLGSRIQDVRNRLAVHLKALTESMEYPGLRRGKLDQRRMYRTAKGIGSKHVFKKVFPGMEMSTAVSIVIDLSGSMGSSSRAGSRSELAMQMGILLAEVFNLLNIPFEVVGFNCHTIGSASEYVPRGSGSFRTNEYINYWKFKEFDDNYLAGDTRFRLGSITGDGHNIDHEVIRWSAGRLWNRSEKRKLMMVLSDGQPRCCSGTTYNGLIARELKKVAEEIERSGMELFAFGLQSQAVKEYYRNHLVLDNIQDLNESALKVLAEYLTKGMAR